MANSDLTMVPASLDGKSAHRIQGNGASGLAARLVWAALRVPLLVGCAALTVYLLLAFSEDAERITLLAIEWAGIPAARLAVFCVSALALAAILRTAFVLGGAAGYPLALAGSALLVTAALHMSGARIVLALPILVVFATNTMPDSVYGRLVRSERANARFMAIAVGVAEFLFLRRYLAWVFGREAPTRGTLLQALPGAAVAAALLALAVKSSPLIHIEQALRMPSFARVLLAGDFNHIELDSDGRRLCVTGHGVPRLLCFDDPAVSTRATEAAVDTGGAQAFALDEAAGEIYVLHTARRELLILDSETLTLRRSVPLPDIAPGDPWIAVHGATGRLAIVSEADEREGAPFMLLDRATGTVLDRRQIDAGNVLLPAGSDVLYMSFFRRRGQLLAYDMRRGEFVAEADAPRRVDRMAYLPEAGEVLLAAPTESRILRFDAMTLRPKGEIPAILGIRSIAIDRRRGILLGASLVTGEVVVIDLSDGRSLARFYVSPWLRTIALDERRGVAFVSSARGLHEVRYEHLR